MDHPTATILPEQGSKKSENKLTTVFKERGGSPDTSFCLRCNKQFNFPKVPPHGVVVGVVNMSKMTF